MVVVVPVYEPDNRLLALVRALRCAAPGDAIVVVDDGSGPAHARVFAAARSLGCTVLQYPDNRGKGSALNLAFRHVAAPPPGEDVVCADSDGQHTVPDILRVGSAVRATGAMVFGARRFT